MEKHDFMHSIHLICTQLIQFARRVTELGTLKMTDTKGNHFSRDIRNSKRVWLVFVIRKHWLREESVAPTSYEIPVGRLPT